MFGGWTERQETDSCLALPARMLLVRLATACQFQRVEIGVMVKMRTLKRICIVAGVFAALALIGWFVPPNQNRGVLQVGDLRCYTNSLTWEYICEDSRKAPKGPP